MTARPEISAAPVRPVPGPRRRRPRSSGIAGTAAAAVLGAVVAGCGGPAPAEGGDDGTVTVFAAASLRGVFEALADAYERDNPGSSIVLNFAGSSDLATQITAGAPADVFASADAPPVERLVGEGLVDGEPAEFARNTLTIAVPRGNPAGIDGFGDLPGVQLVTCAPQVPCGAAVARIEERTGVKLSPVSEEPSVTEVLGKVISGEADAGLVYVTDALAAADEVEAVPLPEAAEVPNTYLIAPVAPGGSEAARRFIGSVTGEPGRTLLREAGFQQPGGRQ